MQVILLKPQGYCHGVNQAINKLETALKNAKKDEPIYLLGEIIHNKHVINHYQKLGINIISEKDNIGERLKEIKKSTIILQAHGSSPLIYEIIKENKLNLIDATCPYVKIIHKKIHHYAKYDYDIIYIGKKGHAESIAAINQVENIHLITSLADIKGLNIKNKNIYITNQTTLSIYDLETYFTILKEKYPNAIIDNKICDATTKRQKAVINAPEVDLTIVVGDKSSSNSIRLFELAKTKNKALFIENLSEIKNYDFGNVKSVALTSGASTPSELVLEVKVFLESIPN